MVHVGAENSTGKTWDQNRIGPVSDVGEACLMLLTWKKNPHVNVGTLPGKKIWKNRNQPLRITRMVENLADGLKNELRRCRELLKEYEKIGPPGAFAAHCIREEIKNGEEAQTSGDVLAMIRAFHALVENKE